MKKLLLLLLVLFTTSAHAKCSYVESTSIMGGVRVSTAGAVFKECVVKSSTNPEAIYYYEVEYDSRSILHTIHNGKLISTEKL